MLRFALTGSFAALLLSACAPKAVETPPEPVAADPALIQEHMAYLASDALEGREAGTPGYDKAADYVAAEFERLGLAPAGTDGYFQPIEFTKGVRKADEVSLTIYGEQGEALPLQNNVDYVVYGSSREASSVVEGAEMVFAGYGIVAPDLGRDDYEGLDVAGKVVVTLWGTPEGIQTEERAYYGSQKGAEAAKRGAIGVISLESPQREHIYPFQRLVGEGRLQEASLSWLAPDGEGYTNAPGIMVAAHLSKSGAEALFADAPMSFEEVVAAAEDGEVAGFALPGTVDMAQASEISRVKSANVIGMIEGTDPALKDEYIVLTAHLDHIGITPSFAEDRINNGALDNAAGVSTLLEAARLIMAGEKPRRSILFLVVTAEEKGLLGAQYFTFNPTVPVESIVADVNLDMPVLTYDFTDVVVFGADRSTIADSVQVAAGEMGLTLSPDPFPEQGIFTRSDHFRFVEIGVPSVFLATGFANGGEEAWAEHFAKNYHRPSDDMNNHLDFEAAARFATLNAAIAMTLANADARPLWKKGDFFARLFDGPQED